MTHTDTVTTVCSCWKVTRQDGAVFGFTDHDVPLVIDKVVYQAACGMDISTLSSGAGLSIGGGDAIGALQAPSLTEETLSAGLWDRAHVELWQVNWKNPEARLCLFAGTLGTILRTQTAFQAELRSLSHLLSEKKGRIFGHLCDARLGDHRCRVNIAAPPYKAQGTLIHTEQPHLLQVSGLGGYEDGFFANGVLRWSGAPEQNQPIEIVNNSFLYEDICLLTLWTAPARLPENGTAFDIYAGCDKRFDTCVNRFKNGLNFQGFPHMPGTEFALSYPSRDTGENDGGVLS